MKITQYFTSPSKESTKKITENNKTLKESEDNVNIENNKTLKESEDNVNIENKTDNNQSDKLELTGKRRKLKKKKNRVPSDPIVKDVTALFSNKLSLISPNVTTSEKRAVSDSEVINTDEGNEKSSNILKNGSEDQGENENTQSPQCLSNVNAFQFMMNSRNNIIGQNSGGKVAPMQQSTSPEEKNKLAARKDVFQNWADQKGAIKRKRDEDDMEYCINYKMEKRARRLKKMLQNNAQVDKEELEVVKVQRKRVRKISSGSESSNDARLINDCEASKLIKSDLKGIDEESVQNKEKQINIDKGQNSLLNFVGFNKNKGDIAVFDDETSNTSLTQKPIIKVKMFTPKKSKKKTLIRECDTGEKLQRPGRSDIDNYINKIEPKESSVLVPANDKSNDESFNSCINSPRRSLRAHTKKVNYSEGDSIKKVKTNENINSSSTCEIPNKLAALFIPAASTDKNVKINKTKCKDTIKIKNKQINYKKQNNSNNDIQEISDSEGESNLKKKSVKVAPLFLKATPKPKVDKETIEARKQFLMSGIPESLKKTVEKQKSMEERVYNIFPLKSHIQQKCDNPYWNLSRPELNFLEESEFEEPKSDCINLVKREGLLQPNFIVSEKLHNIKYHLNNIKTENPNYPVYKIFRHIYQNSGHVMKKAVPKKSPRKKSKKRRSTDEPINISESTNLNKHELWTEKYRPKTPEQILGNQKVVDSLKNWLETWMNYSKKVNSKAKRIQKDATSESEFDYTDCDSRDSTRMLSNTMILTGPCGSGKTNAVYIIANELGFNVLEVNSSSRRTGKKIIQELQEATQSHQVRKKGTITSSGQINEDSEMKGKEKSKKMCILLVEDIDLVFDQDEGFLSSLSQLILTSKRPIILTTTDTTPLHVQKLLNQHECITFRPIYKEILGVWLQIVCLVEGLLVDKNDIGHLLNYYKGDVRKALLAAQYWCQSGGQLNRECIYFLSTPTLPEPSPLNTVDDDLKISVEENTEKDSFVHAHSLACFEICGQYRIPYGLDIGKIWWNIPFMLNMPDCYERLYRNGFVANQNNKEDETDIISVTSAHIDSLSTFYDSLILADELYKTTKWSSEEPIVNGWISSIRDSLELTDRKEDIPESVNLTCDITHTLMNGCIQRYQDMHNINPKVDLTVPNSFERRWRTKQHMLENYLKQAVPTINILERSAVAIDYLSALRQIARLEDRRALANTKRGNRFRHYFRDLNMDFNENKSKSCCNILHLSTTD